jgi:hypothetical protein
MPDVTAESGIDLFSTLLAVSIGPLRMAELAAIGLLAGVLGGLLGVGGGLIMIPAMYLLLGNLFGDGSFHLYKLASISASIVVALPATWRHAREKAIVPGMVVSIVPGALIGVVVGVAAASLFEAEQTDGLRRTFGGFMLIAVAFGLYQSRQRGSGDQSFRTQCPLPRRRVLIGGAVGLPAGLIAGLLGVGGGIWAVPAQNTLLGVRLRNAIANSACMIVFVAIGASIVQSVAVARMPGLQAIDGWMLTLFLAPGALLGGWIGAGLTHRIPTGGLRIAVNLLLTAAGLRLLLG